MLQRPSWQLVDVIGSLRELPKIIKMLEHRFGKDSVRYAIKPVDWEYPKTVEIWHYFNTQEEQNEKRSTN